MPAAKTKIRRLPDLSEMWLATSTVVAPVMERMMRRRNTWVLASGTFRRYMPTTDWTRAGYTMRRSPVQRMLFGNHRRPRANWFQVESRGLPGQPR